MGGSEQAEVPAEAVRIASEPSAVDLEPDPTTLEARGLLAQRVPLTLLADLAAPEGPASKAIMDAEGLPEEAWWAPSGAEPGTPGPGEEPEVSSAQ